MEGVTDIFVAQGSSREGLSSREAARRLAQYGPNEFAGRKKLRPLLIFLSKFKSPLLILLIVAAVVSGVLGSRIEAGVIIVIVFVSAFIDFFKSGRLDQNQHLEPPVP